MEERRDGESTTEANGRKEVGRLNTRTTKQIVESGPYHVTNDYRPYCSSAVYKGTAVSIFTQILCASIHFAEGCYPYNKYCVYIACNVNRRRSILCSLQLLFFKFIFWRNAGNVMGNRRKVINDSDIHENVYVV